MTDVHRGDTWVNIGGAAESDGFFYFQDNAPEDE